MLEDIFTPEFCLEKMRTFTLHEVDNVWDEGIRITRKAIPNEHYDITISVAMKLGEISFQDIEEYLKSAGGHYRRYDKDNTKEAIKFYYFNGQWSKLLAFFEINVDKYINRYISKHYNYRETKEKSRNDLLKAIHYSLLYMLLKDSIEFVGKVR